MKLKDIIGDREVKVMKMRDMIHSALRKSKNVPIKLSLSVLDKQFSVL